NAADKVAKATGMSRRTLERAAEIVAAAEAAPERYGKLLQQMDRSGRVNGVHRRLRVLRAEERLRAEPPPWPGNGPYRVGVIDLPWPPCAGRQDDPSQEGTLAYPTLTIAEIYALPIPSLMHEDSILWLWTTNNHMRAAHTVLDAWGFREKTLLTWAKDKFGL